MDIEQIIASTPFWFHSIDVGNGVVTPGQKSSKLLELELSRLKLPSLHGKSILDVGAWDGYFSFECEKLGARRICALDHYVWCMDLYQQQKYYQNCLNNNSTPIPYENLPANWKPHDMPGKSGFDSAHLLLKSNVEQKVLNFMSCDIVEIGCFDIVLFLGVLYHLKNPFESIKRIAMISHELAIIETAAIIIEGSEDKALFEFYGKNEFIGDVGNWWAPNKKALIDMCLASGFKTADVVNIIPHIESDGNPSTSICRIILHAKH